MVDANHIVWTPLYECTQASVIAGAVGQGCHIYLPLIFLTIHARVSGMRDWSKSQPSSLPLVKERANAVAYRRVKTPQS